jgi:hypothetical protein
MNKEIYLDKIIKYLEEDTIIKRDPSYYDPTTGSGIVDFPFSTVPITMSLGILRNVEPDLDFLVYCEETYGLSDEESEYVWEEYSTKIYLKVICNM